MFGPLPTLLALLSQYKLTKADGRGDLSLQPELDQIKRVKGREGRCIEGLLTELDSESISHKGNFRLI